MPPGFTQIDDAAILRSREVGASAFQVYAAIAQHVREGRKAWPGLERIAEITGLSTRWIRQAIRTLESAGWLVVERAKGRPNIYRLPPIKSKEPDFPTPNMSKEPDFRTVRNSSSVGAEVEFRGVRNSSSPEGNHRSKPGSKPLKQTKARGCAAPVLIPKELDSDVFREAWGRWTAHRKEIKKKLTPTTTAAQLKRLAAWGEARAVAAIERSIEAGWTGIFEEKKNGGNGHARKNGFPCGPGQRHAGTSGKIGVF